VRIAINNTINLTKREAKRPGGILPRREAPGEKSTMREAKGRVHDRIVYHNIRLLDCTRLLIYCTRLDWF
jgi:hypothetical protein